MDIQKPKKRYRVLYSDKAKTSKFESKPFDIIEATSEHEAISIVKANRPGMRVTKGWLIEK